MGKTKAEIIAEYRDLKKENLKLTNQLEHWKAIARKENDRVVDLAKKLDQKETEITEWEDTARKESGRVDALATKLAECEKEKTLIKSQRDVLLKEAEEHCYQLNDLQQSFDILQAEVRKIQIDEGVIHDQAYEAGYKDAERKFSQAIDHREKEIEDLLDHCDIHWWILRQLHENATK